MKRPTQEKPVTARPKGSVDLTKLIEQYGCGPVPFIGSADALHERHLLFDNVRELIAVGDRERFEAAARSVRDVLSQRWLRTEETYQRQNCKRVYYLSIEFLLGRSLANNITNLPLDPAVNDAVKREKLDWYEIVEEEPDAGLGNGGLGRLADLKSYLEVDQRLRDLYTEPDAWARKAILNVAASGKFSSDRTIAEYADAIWKVGPCPVSWRNGQGRKKIGKG